eukprot:c13703_g1_i1 orf=153-407(+)
MPSLPTYPTILSFQNKRTFVFEPLILSEITKKRKEGYYFSIPTTIHPNSWNGRGRGFKLNTLSSPPSSSLEPAKFLVYLVRLML